MKKVAIIDLGSGNLYSVLFTFQLAGCMVEIIKTCPKLDDFDIVVLPGVGSAGFVSEKLHVVFGNWLHDRMQSGMIIIGICLGFQLMCEGTDESGGILGLNFFPGSCRLLKSYEEDLSMRIGWNEVEYNALINPVLSNKSIKNTYGFYYFNHAYGLPYESITVHNYDFGIVDNSIAWIRRENTS